MTQKDFNGKITDILQIGAHKAVELTFLNVDPAKASQMNYGDSAHIAVQEIKDPKPYHIDAEVQDVSTDNVTGRITVTAHVLPVELDIRQVYPDNNRRVIDSAEDLQEKGNIFALS